jgi:hypothetical protein
VLQFRGSLGCFGEQQATKVDLIINLKTAKIGVSQSALSHTIRGLEERLGLRLLTRTTRSVAPTAAGERLLRTVGPRFDEIENELDALTALREKPAGDVRITAGEHPAETILWPRSNDCWPTIRTSRSKSRSTLA